MRILLVEACTTLGDELVDAVTRSGHEVDWARNFRAAEQTLGSNTHDVVLLDADASGVNVPSAIRGYREGGSRALMLVISSGRLVAERIAALDAGADDYLTKPLNLGELAARLRALSRRTSGSSRRMCEHRGLTIDVPQHEACLNGTRLQLRPREFSLLLALVENPGRVCRRAELVERLYGWKDHVSSNAIEVHVCSLRRKLGAESIQTIRGIGYQLGSW